jgi:hypothetical protein
MVLTKFLEVLKGLSECDDEMIYCLSWLSNSSYIARLPYVLVFGSDLFLRFQPEILVVREE